MKKIGWMMETVTADKPHLIPGVDGEPVIQVVMPTQTSKAMPSASTVISSGEKRCALTSNKMLGTRCCRGNIQSRSFILARPVPLTVNSLTTDSWKSDDIGAAVQMMDTTRMPCIPRDDSEKQELSLHNQQVRRPRQ